jgi:aurora kinase
LKQKNGTVVLFTLTILPDNKSCFFFVFPPIFPLSLRFLVAAMFPMSTPTRHSGSESGGGRSGSAGLRSNRKASWSLADFDIGRKLGEGRFGKIYLAREKATKYAVVLKCISKEAVVHHDLLHQIRREVELHMFCRHRHIIRMLAYFWDDDCIYLVLEHAEGGDLMHALAAQFGPSRRTPDRIAATLVAQLCSALKYLHHHKILHRDVKPENILLKKGTVKLADFTWAVLCHDRNPHAVNPNRRATVCGTLDYMSPELVSGAEYDSGVDCWAVGALTYELLTGNPPFLEETELATCRRIRQGQLTASPVSDPLVSPAAMDFVSRLLAVDATRRMTMAEALRHPWLAEARAVELRGKSQSVQQEQQQHCAHHQSSLVDGEACGPSLLPHALPGGISSQLGSSGALGPASASRSGGSGAMSTLSAVSTSTVVLASNASLLNKSQQRPATAPQSATSTAGRSTAAVHPAAGQTAVERALDMTPSDDERAAEELLLLSRNSTAEGVHTLDDVSSLREVEAVQRERQGSGAEQRTPTPKSDVDEGFGGGGRPNDARSSEWRNASLEMTAISVSNNVSAAEGFL